MISELKLCLIGDIVVDVTLKTSFQDTKLRLGGIIHAARCLWALNIPFSVGYYAPAYLDAQIIKYLNSLGCYDIIKLGNITGAPYVFLIEEIKEVGDQGYEFLLRDEIVLDVDAASVERLIQANFTEYLLISGNYNSSELINCLSGNIHLDVANNIKDFSELQSLNKKLSSVFVSTSSDIFKSYYKSDFSIFSTLFQDYAERLILKENRGGSRGIEFKKQEIISVPAQTRPIVHSVGVGDVYNASFVSHYKANDFQKSLVLSSWIAAEYASTTYPDDFKTGVTRIISSDLKDLVSLGGVSLPWEARESINIYIAAPDFEFVDTKPIDKLESSLQYHNFKPRRPVRENGQMEKDASKKRKQELFSKDMALFAECSILVAVLLYDDPGTLIEIGLAAAIGMPTIIYDPYQRAANCMLTELPTLVSHDLDEIISEVFIRSANL